MYAFLAKRLLQMILTLFLFQAATYFLIDAQPGDIADLLVNNPEIPPSQRNVLRRDLGLDKPPVERFFTYLGNFYRGDLGVSFLQYPRPVIDIIRERLPRTVVLFLSASIISFWAGFITGKVLAWRRGGFIEYGSTIGGVTLYTVFTPWFGLMMIWLFAVQLDLLPAGKFLDPVKWLGVDVSANDIFIRMIASAFIALMVMLVGFILSNRLEPRFRLPLRLAGIVLPLLGVLQYWNATGEAVFAADIAEHTVLPVLTVTLIAYGGTMLLTRTSMLETLREDYILSARAKGLPEKMVRDKHAARTALLPVWTGLVFSIGNSVSGGIITESIFSWPGLGLTLLVSATQADIPVALGALTVVGILTLVSHLIADVGYAFLDPRIRYH
jgi:peptide/nickel transport system permease protein